MTDKLEQLQQQPQRRGGINGVRKTLVVLAIAMCLPAFVASVPYNFAGQLGWPTNGQHHQANGLSSSTVPITRHVPLDARSQFLDMWKHRKEPDNQINFYRTFVDSHSGHVLDDAKKKVSIYTLG